jgi:hypothetical protein
MKKLYAILIGAAIAVLLISSTWHTTISKQEQAIEPAPTSSPIEGISNADWLTTVRK